MTLTRLLITVLVLLVLTGGFIAWFWEYAHSPQGRAMTIFCELRKETTGSRAWMLRHGIIREEVGVIRKLVGPGHAEDLLREASGNRLASLGPEVIPVLIQGLTDSDFAVRKQAAIACGKLKDKRTVKSLIDCMGSENSPRIACLRSLGEIGGPEARHVIEQVLLNESSAHMDCKCEAANALAQCADSSAIPSLVKVIGADLKLDASCLMAIARIQARCGVARKYQSQILEALGRLKPLTGYDYELMCYRNVIEASFGDAKATAKLQKMIAYCKQDDSWMHGGELPAEILYRGGIEEVLNITLSKMNSNSVSIRQAAVGTICCEQTIPALVKATNDQDWYVRYEAAECLSSLPGAPTAPLKAMLKDPAQIVRWAALFSLVCQGVQDDWSQYDIETPLFD